VQLGQVAVEHDNVVRVDARVVERRGAVAHHLDGRPGAAQSAGERRRHPRVVLEDQEPHVRWEGRWWAWPPSKRDDAARRLWGGCE
jgi:hypothetical protein